MLHAVILTELDMEVFIRMVGIIVERFRLENLFYVKDTDGKIIYLLE